MNLISFSYLKAKKMNSLSPGLRNQKFDNNFNTTSLKNSKNFLLIYLAFKISQRKGILKKVSQ